MTPFGGGEFTRCRDNFRGEKLNRRCVICSKNKSGDTVFEREAYQLFSPLLGRSMKQGTTGWHELAQYVQQAAHNCRRAYIVQRDDVVHYWPKRRG